MANPYETYSKHIAVLKAMETQGKLNDENIKGINFLRKRGINVEQLFKYASLATSAPAENTAKPAQGLGTSGYVPMTSRLIPTHHEEDCAVEHDDDGSVYVEEKVEVGGSIGGISDEGCSEHYFSRFIKLDAEGGEEEPDYDALKFAIVTGDVLNRPAYVKYCSRRK